MPAQIRFTPTIPVLLAEDEVRILAHQFEDKVRTPHREFHQKQGLPRCPSCDAQDSLHRTLSAALVDHMSIRLHNS